MKRALNAGSTSLWKAAQCEQVKEAYSITVTGASARPSTRSAAVTGGTSAAKAEPEEAVVASTASARR